MRTTIQAQTRQQLSSASAWRVAVALTIAAFAHVAGAQVLWQTFSAGMTLDQVRSSAPSAEAVDRPDAKLSSGARERLQLRNIEIVGKPFAASFFFIDNRLTDVQLVHEATQDPSIGRATYTDLVTALRSKYGNELNSEVSGGLGWHGSTTWASGATTITLTAFLIGDSTFISVGYGSRMSKAADKL